MLRLSSVSISVFNYLRVISSRPTRHYNQLDDNNYNDSYQFYRESIFADTPQFFVSSPRGAELVDILYHFRLPVKTTIDLRVRTVYDLYLPVKTCRVFFNELMSIESYCAYAELLTVNPIAVLLSL